MSRVLRCVRVLFLGLGFLAGVSNAPMVQGQASPAAFPKKPVHIIVPFPAGGPTDVLARGVGQKLAELWGQPVIVDNKPGAGSMIGIDAAAKAEPDGHTISMVTSSFVINPSIQPKLPYDTLKDLTGVTQLALAQVGLLAHPSVPANNVRELIALAKAKPGALSFASVGAGSSSHLPGEMLKSAARIDMLHVPYKGSGPATLDLLNGRVQLMFDVLPAQLGNIKSGKLKLLAVASEKRLAMFPAAPTMAETLPGFEVTTLFGVVTSSGTPRDVVRKLNADIVKVLNAQDLKDRIVGLGLEPVGSTPEQFDAFIRSEIRKWSEVVKSSGAKVN